MGIGNTTEKTVLVLYPWSPWSSGETDVLSDSGRYRQRAQGWGAEALGLWEPRRLVQFSLWDAREGFLEEGMSGLRCEE